MEPTHHVDIILLPLLPLFNVVEDNVTTIIPDEKLIMANNGSFEADCHPFGWASYTEHSFYQVLLLQVFMVRLIAYTCILIFIDFLEKLWL